jgi:Flp pilus assembly protein TadD
MNVMMLRGLGFTCALTLSSMSFAQAVDESALEELDRQTPVAAPSSEPAGAAELRSAMRRISLSPTDADALADAGNASLALGDANAALNFFTRANALRPNNSRIVSGLAIATVRTENPFEALRLFDDAIRLGANERSIAADRALAFDLLGNFGRAQQDYKLARSAAASDDIVIRQSISLSLAGQKEEADAMLVPLLQKNNATAWRARAFMLAARGDLRESNKVAQGFMDTTSAQRMERFFRLMPTLTSAQQAAAIHLGHFPVSQYVGRDSEQVRKVAAALPTVDIPRGESRLIPTGAPLGTKSTKPAVTSATVDPKKERKQERRAREREEVKAAVANIPDALKLPKTDTARLGTAEARAKVEEAQSARIASVNTGVLPVPETARPLVRVVTPTRQTTAAPSVSDVARTPPATSTGIAATTTPSPAVTQTVQLATPVPVTTANTVPTTLNGPPAPQASTLTVATAAPVTIQPQLAAPVPTPQPTATPVAVPASSTFDLGALVSSIEIPESEQVPSQVPVDLKKLKPAAPKVAAVDAAKTAKVDPKAAAKAKAENANPARFWVQIATGDASALGFDYRKWVKKNPELFKSQNPWTSPWGKTDRLLVGPFADMKAAKKWEGDFKKAGGGGFMWKSEIGVPVIALKTK